MEKTYKTCKTGSRCGGRIYMITKEPLSIKPRFLIGEELEQLNKPELYKSKQNIKRRYNGMKKEILTFIEDLKDLRKECVEHCEATCTDTKLSHEGKVSQISHNIDILKKWADERSEEIVLKLRNKIEAINAEETADLRKKRESSEYNNRLMNMRELLEKTADRLTDEEIKISLEQFANDPIAIEVFWGMFGYKRLGVLPEDNRGKRQELLQKVINNVQHSVEMLTDVKYQEDTFMNSFFVNGFYLSNTTLLMFDMAFVESLTDDCTQYQNPENNAPDNKDFGFGGFQHINN